MSAHIPKTQEEVLTGLIAEVVSAILQAAKLGTLDIDNFFVKRVLLQAEKVKQANWSIYYELLAYIEMYKRNFKKANQFLDNALKLNSSNITALVNRQRILMNLGCFDEVEKWILENYRYDDIDLYSAQSMFHIAVANLDFRNFMKYYENSYNKLSLVMDVKEIANHFPNYDELAKDIECIGLNKALFKQAMIFIYTFHRQITHEAYQPYFKIDTSDIPTLIVEMFLNIDVDTAIGLTSDFEEAFVDFALEQDNMDLLRKFSVFIKPSSLLDSNKEYPVYAGINKNWVV